MIKIESPFHPLAHLDGARIVVLNWRDVEHPQAGGAEQYMHQIARRWVEIGAHVTWLTARAPGQSRRAVIDGIEVVGPIPFALQIPAIFSAGLMTASSRRQQAGDLLRHLASSEFADALRTAGLEP